MMKHYIEISLLPCAEMPLHILTQQVFEWVHLKCVTLQNKIGVQPIGVSFPKYNAPAFTLGDKIRLFCADNAILSDLDFKSALKPLHDYVHITNIRPVPLTIQHGCFKRLQLKSNNLRLARRKAKRENIAIETALTRLTQFDEAQTSAPFIFVKSGSTGQAFPLFIVFEERASACNGEFGTYGLSAESTVPLF